MSFFAPNFALFFKRRYVLLHFKDYCGKWLYSTVLTGYPGNNQPVKWEIENVQKTIANEFVYQYIHEIDKFEVSAF